MHHLQIIQGGMGVAVSGWALASAVAQLGQLGVVSGTALPIVLARRLQQGDPGGELRKALNAFPLPHLAGRILREYFVQGGRPPRAPYKPVAMPTLQSRPLLVELTVLANFVEVFLAKMGHAGLIGINYLEKIQIPTLPSLYGAMLAGVDCVLMGAGIPRAIPGILDRLAQGLSVSLPVDVQGSLPGDTFATTFDPRQFCGGAAPQLKRPPFLAIVASATLAITLARKASGRVDGFVVEGHTAGGHNAPPRGPLHLTADGQPLYGPRDLPELDKIRALGLPFWLAGGYGRPGKLAEARALGATGIQVGTPFAFCAESGIHPDLKRRVLALCRQGPVEVFTDPLASPTGFPFKVAQVEGTLSESSRYAARKRICDLGYLRHLYRKSDGTIGYRCPAEPLGPFQHKGGELDQTTGRKCICNGLLATAGLGQIRRNAQAELPYLTAGDDLRQIAYFLPPDRDSYSAADVVRALLGDPNPAPPARQGESD